VNAARRALNRAPALEVSKVEGHDRFEAIGKKMSRDRQAESKTKFPPLPGMDRAETIQSFGLLNNVKNSRRMRNDLAAVKRAMRMHRARTFAACRRRNQPLS